MSNIVVIISNILIFWLQNAGGFRLIFEYMKISKIDILKYKKKYGKYKKHKNTSKFQKNNLMFHSFTNKYVTNHHYYPSHYQTFSSKSLKRFLSFVHQEEYCQCLLIIIITIIPIFKIGVICSSDHHITHVKFFETSDDHFLL